MVKLYTLPGCGICNVVRMKLERANIPFEKEEGEDFFVAHGIENAPVLVLDNGEKLCTPSIINTWIKENAR